MPTHLLDPIAASPASRYLRRQRENLLAAVTGDLASLRYAIILTAKWEAASGSDMERRDGLRADLVLLRRQYSQKIDDIAMTFNVQNAIDAKGTVERAVSIPRGMDIDITPPEDNAPCV